jgi:predicted MPP superfamily phosphohydrolase
MSLAATPEPVTRIDVAPVLRVPLRPIAGQSYVMSVDLTHDTPPEAWPYSKEEFTLTCLIKAHPLFRFRAIGDGTLTLHRFGGTYAAAQFLLWAGEEGVRGSVEVTLVNASGLPVLQFATPELEVMASINRARAPLGETPRASEAQGPSFVVPRAEATPDSTTQPVTWLHLSDLHAQAGSTLDSAYRLRDDLRRVQEEHGLYPDFIFFTGDAVSGRPGDPLSVLFEQAWYFFEMLRESFDPPIPAENLFLIPGNHDAEMQLTIEQVGWLDEQARSPRGLKTISGMFESGGPALQAYMDRFAAYREFLSSAGYKHLLQDPERFIYAHLREVRGVTVGIGGFNSAWSSGRNDAERLWMAGESQIHRIAKTLGPAQLRIALIHHPVAWLAIAERSQVEAGLLEEFDLVLRGHEHQGFSRELRRNAKWTRRGLIAAGSSSVRGGLPCDYNWGQLNLVQGEGRIWLRRYERSSGSWMPEVVEGVTDLEGIFELRPETIQSWGVVSRLPIEKSQDLEVREDEGTPLSVEGPESRGVYGRTSDIQKLQKLLESNPIVLVHGLTGIGKTKLIEEVQHTPRFAAYRYTDFSLHPGTSFEDLYAGIAKALGGEEADPQPQGIGNFLDFRPISNWTQDKPPCIIHVRRIHELFERTSRFEPRVQDFLLAVVERAPETRLVLESPLKPPEGLLPASLYTSWHVRGLGVSTMTDFFSRPFPERTNVGWHLSPSEAEEIAARLGGGRSHRHQVHPMGMFLLASVADGLGLRPTDILAHHQSMFEEELNKSLFDRIYQQVLGSYERDLLNLCALYRPGVGIPESHIERLTHHVGAKPNTFAHLVWRSILTPNGPKLRYELHTLVGGLVLAHLDPESEAVLAGHRCVADAWLAEAKLGERLALPKVEAANEAFYHLLKAQEYRRLNEIQASLLGRNQLAWIEEEQKRLYESRKYDALRLLLDLWISLEPSNPKPHRFLGEAIDRLEGRGTEAALYHFEMALSLKPGFPPYLSGYGRCLLARGEADRFLAYFEELDPHDRYQALKDSLLISVYSHCLEQAGKGEDASKLRQERIREGVRHAAFYNDEALLLYRQKNPKAALTVLDRADSLGVSDEYTLAIRASILDSIGEKQAASQIRLTRIKAGALNPAFYNDEAKFLLSRNRLYEALELLDLAAARGCANQATNSLRSVILKRLSSQNR